MVWLVGLIVAALVSVVGVVADRRRVGALRARLEDCRSEAARLEVSRARLEARQEAALAEAERLRLVEQELKSSLATAEQEKTRLDFELRQVALVASRVPLLEPRVEELAVARRELARARERIAEFVPVAAELELRNQFIETLQRELSYRDERVLALEHRVDQLTALLAATEAAEGAEGAEGATNEPLPASPGDGDVSVDLDVRFPASCEDDNAPEPGFIELDEVDDRPAPPVARALEQVLRRPVGG